MPEQKPKYYCEYCNCYRYGYNKNRHIRSKFCYKNKTRKNNNDFINEKYPGWTQQNFAYYFTLSSQIGDKEAYKQTCKNIEQSKKRNF